MSTLLEQLATLRCPECEAYLRVVQDRPLVDAEEVCILSVRCRCGYVASVSALTAEDACEALHRHVLSPGAAPPSPRRPTHNRRLGDPPHPYLALASARA